MRLKFVGCVFVFSVFFCCFATTGFCDSRYDRELIVQDKTRAMQVESVFKDMMAAYEDEDARSFLDYVSDERFRQDYITFTDALYNDFRNFEIHQVDYWIDRVVPDNVKQFLFVQWEKRFENLDDGRQLIQKGFSRFLFDEVDGEYLLIELAGNHLFGGSLQEWREEVPMISGQEATVSQSSTSGDNSGDTSGVTICDGSNLNLCVNENDCGSYGGYWYNNTCNVAPQGQPDLTVEAYDFFYDSSTNTTSLYYRVNNSGTAASSSCQLQWNDTGSISMPEPPITVTVDSVAAGSSVTGTIVGAFASGRLTIDIGNMVSESDESNNVTDY